MPPSDLHHLVGYPTEEEGVGPGEVLGMVTVQVFIWNDRAMIAAAVQRDVDGVPKGAHGPEDMADRDVVHMMPATPPLRRRALQEHKYLGIDQSIARL
jgi:hypothetical protein